VLSTRVLVVNATFKFSCHANAAKTATQAPSANPFTRASDAAAPVGVLLADEALLEELAEEIEEESLVVDEEGAGDVDEVESVGVLMGELLVGALPIDALLVLLVVALLMDALLMGELVAPLADEDGPGSVIEDVGEVGRGL